MPTSPLIVSNPPEIAGLCYRLLTPKSDFPKMSYIYNLATSLDNPTFLPRSPESFAQELGTQTADQRQNLLIVEADGEMIGWGNCDVFRQRKTRDVGFYEFFLLPEWRNRGIERPAWRYFETRVSELLCDSSAAERIFKIAVNDTDAYQMALLQSAGYTQLAAHAIMVRPDLEHIPDCPLPDGIEIRPVKDEDIRKIYEAQREAFKEHIHGSDPGDEDFDEWVHDDTLADRSLWIVAWDTQMNQIAGLILNFILAEENAFYNRKRGYVEYISVLQPYRRRGLARAMIAASLRQYKARGMAEAALSSHTENPFNPISLYRDMGFQVRYHTLIYSKPISR